ncbi:hypothetical protein, partial [Bacillus paralicheniformis]|uniref:hypothetical protein n=1 Tax=Bacillus paralicheniformis TaxID=1648923 RepID=UPI001A9C7045
MKQFDWHESGTARIHAFSFGLPSSCDCSKSGTILLYLNKAFPSSSKTIKFFRKILNIFSTTAGILFQIYKYKI